VLFVGRQRRVLVAAISILTIVWNGVYLPIGRPINVASADPSFYEPVASFVSSVPGVHKVEVVSTNVRRESDLLAMRFPIARGWQTQIDRDRNEIFYSGTLTPSTYLEWLRENAVSFVAVPKKFVHAEAEQEAAVVASMTSSLRAVYENDNWRIYEVVDAQPLASGSATVVAVSPEQISVARITARVDDSAIPIHAHVHGHRGRCVCHLDRRWLDSCEGRCRGGGHPDGQTHDVGSSPSPLGMRLGTMAPFHEPLLHTFFCHTFRPTDHLGSKASVCSSGKYRRPTPHCQTTPAWWHF